MAKTAEKPAESTDVTKAAQTGVAEAALMNQFFADAGAGFEEASAASFAIPFIQILQSGSPQCKKSEGAYIKGAEEGMFYNTVTQEVFSGEDGIIVIPCHYSHRFNEWTPRESGGGFVAEHPSDTELVNMTKKDSKERDALPNGNLLVDTRNHYVLVVDKEGNFSPAIISMSSTQLKKSRQWMSKMNGIKMKNPANGAYVTAPMASRMYRLTTQAESNDKGSWFGFRIELAGVVEDMALYSAAMEFRDAVKEGRAKAAKPVDETHGAAEHDVSGDKEPF